MNSKINQLMTTDAFEKEKDKIFEKCLYHLKQDEELISIWAELCDKQIEIDISFYVLDHMDSVKRIWYLSPMRAAPEPSLLAHTSSESRGTFRQKTRSLTL